MSTLNCARRMRRLLKLAAVVAAAAACRPVAAAQLDNTWTLDGNGNWNNSANWSLGQVPNNNATDTFNVYIDGGDTLFNVIVSLNQVATIDNLSVDAGDELRVLNALSLDIAGSSIANNGTISLASAGSFTDLLIGSAGVSLSGNGTLAMGTHANNRILGSASTNQLTNSAGHTISGGGQLGVNLLALVNQGLIDANKSGVTMTVDPSATGATNTGTMRAASGVLLLRDGGFANTGGTIQALDASIVRLDGGAHIIGGTLTTAGTGLIELYGNTVTLESLSNSGSMRINNGVSPVLVGTLTNDGTIQQNSAGGLTDLTVSGNVTLTGTGFLTFSNHANNRIIGLAPTDVLTHGPSHTIQGSGQIGVNTMGFVNSGLVDANKAVGLTIDPSAAGVTNNGVMRAGDGGRLTLRDGVFTNTGGTIQALDASIVRLDGGAHIIGGTLTTAGTGAVEVYGNTVTLQTLTNAGLLKINNGVSPVLMGTITNNGTIQQNSVGSLTDLTISGSVTLAGTGSLTFSNNGSNRIVGLSPTDVLTNGPGHAIQGSGQIGVNTMGLVNNGLVDANKAIGLTIAPSAAGVTNNSVMRASDGGKLILQGGTFTNTGGSIQALLDSRVQLTAGAHIVGGTLGTFDNGVIEIVGDTVTLQSLTISGLVQVNDNIDPVLVGTITNNGTIKQNSAGSQTDLRIAGDVTLSGTGNLTLSNHVNNRIFGLSDTDVLTNEVGHTIQGAGQIGADWMGFVNKGLVDANVSKSLTVDPSGPGGVANQGVMQASAGGTLNIQHGEFTNTGATIRALDGSLVQLLFGAYINGGTLTTAGSGVVRVAGLAVTLHDLTNSGLIQINNGMNPMLVGTITNGGTIELNSASSNTDLRIFGNVALNGGGKIKLSNNNNNRIYGFNATDVLTNATGHTIEGAGQLGANQMGLINNGLVDANVSVALTVDPSGAGVVNNGTMRASGVGTLALVGGTFNNTAGAIQAQTGSTVQLGGGAHIIGGSLSTTGSGLIRLVGNTVTLESVAIDGLVRIPNAISPTLAGAITNNGTIEQNSAGSLTDLRIDGLVTLGGSGVLTLSNNGNNRIFGLGLAASDVLTNGANHTIQGSGQLGLNMMGLVNNGTISANQSVPLTIVTTGGISGTGTLSMMGTASATADHIRQSGLTMGDNATATIRANGGAAGTSKVETLTMSGLAQLNLKDNDLVIGTGVLADIQALIKSGYNSGAWNGKGIRSDMISGINADKALGYAAGNDPTISALGNMLSGQSFDGDSVIVKYTYAADANLDGQVDVVDLGILATHWQGTGKVWTSADFNYSPDGKVDVVDLGILATNWQKGVGSPLNLSFADALRMFPEFSDVTVVPEPTASALILAAGALALLRRRER